MSEPCNLKWGGQQHAQFFGTNIRARDMRSATQFCKMIRLDGRKIFTGSTTSHALAKTFLSRLLTRGLLAVLNLLIDTGSQEVVDVCRQMVDCVGGRVFLNKSLIIPAVYCVGHFGDHIKSFISSSYTLAKVGHHRPPRKWILDTALLPDVVSCPRGNSFFSMLKSLTTTLRLSSLCGTF